MTPLQIVFILIALATLASAIMVVSARRVMHSALWLILALLGVAATFATLETDFFTVVQIVVYIGAIATLIIFAVMLTRRDQHEQGGTMGGTAWISALVALAVVGSLIAVLSGWDAFTATRGGGGEDLLALGKAFVSPDAYAIPFEVASVLLIGALIGAIYVANEPKQ